MATSHKTPDTVITLTLPTPEGGGIAPERATATLLIQRGELAHIHQFHYQGALSDLTDAIRAAFTALGEVESNPPVVPDLPQEKLEKAPAADDEPAIDIPLKKGTKAVKISHLKIVGGENDAAAYRQATMLAGRLIDGGLWDGNSPIHFHDVYATAKKMKPLTDSDFSLFELTDFVGVPHATKEDLPDPS